MVISYELWPLAFCLSWFNICIIKMMVMFYIFFQHLHMIKMSSVSTQTRDIVMDLRKFWHDTEKLSLNWNSQVLCLFFPDPYVFKIVELDQLILKPPFFSHLMAGPTSFAPIIEMAITIVEQSVGQYHVLVIIADGQVIHLCLWFFDPMIYFLSGWALHEVLAFWLIFDIVL